MVAVTLLGTGLFASSICLAQQSTAEPAAAATSAAASARSSPKSASSAAKAATGPTWAELAPAQQQALKPLQGNWNSLTEAHKRKWLVMSTSYPKMTAPEQARVHSRMTEWATLSAKQRSEARLNFAEIGQHSTDDKQAKWQAYQQLSAEEREKLGAGKPKTKGAAPAVKPVPTQKLAVVPSSRHDHKQHPAIAGAGSKLDHNTLLPQTLPSPVGAPVEAN